jgi:hypothetical protein
MSAPLPSLALTRTVDDYADLALQCLRPSQGDDLWEWCSRNLVLYTRERWNPRQARIMRHWYRVASARITLRPDPRDPYAHRCEQIWLDIGAQIAKSTLGFATVGGTAVNSPRIVGYYRNRLEDLKNDRDRKLKRIVELTPVLNALLPRGAAALKSALSSRSWALGNALIYFRSASIADDLRSDPIELAVLDEYDTYPEDVEGYGDPIDQILARQRTTAKTRLTIGITTPGLVAGHGWRRLCSGTHERPLVDCPDCGAAQDLDPARVCLADGRDLKQVSKDEIRASKLGRFACAHCGSLWNATQMHAAIARMLDIDRPWCPGKWEQDPTHPNGRWIAQADFDQHHRLQRIAPPDAVVRSGQASSLFSPHVTLDSFAASKALALQGTVQQLKTFTNNEAAEPFIYQVAEVDADDLTKNAQPTETYQRGVLTRPGKHHLILFLDQQGNTRGKFWFPWVLRAVEPGVGSWLIDEGAAANEDEALDLESRTWQIAGEHRRPDLIGRDSANGNYRFDAYRWAAGDPAKRILVRGDGTLAIGIPWKEVVESFKERRKTPKPAGVREYRIAPHYWRDILWDQIRGVQRPPPAADGEDADEVLPAAPTMRWWLPSDVSNRYKASLTSEEQVIEKRRIDGMTREMVVWRPRVITTTADKQTYRDDNHWWDAEACITAVINIKGWDRPEIVLDVPGASAPIGGGFMDGFT